MNDERAGTRGAGGRGGMREDQKRWGKKKKVCFRKKKTKKKQKTGHLARWNYISDAHTTLTLLSHQHMALAEMVYVHVCVDVSAHVCVGDC